MSAIKIRDLAHNRELDDQAMSTVRGGASPFANVNLENVGNVSNVGNVNIELNQSTAVLTAIDIAVLNNNNVIGAKLDVELDIAPKIAAKNSADISLF